MTHDSCGDESYSVVDSTYKSTPDGKDNDTPYVEIHVSKAKDATSEQRDAAADGINLALEQLYNHGSIKGYLIQTIDTNFEHHSAIDSSTYLSQWTDFRNCAGGDLWSFGAHLLTVPTSGDPARGGADIGEPSAFTADNGKSAWIDSEYYTTDPKGYQAGAVQEVFHTLLHVTLTQDESDKWSCGSTRRLIDGCKDQHDLGDRVDASTLFSYISPMLWGYHETRTPCGDCDRSYTKTPAPSTSLNRCEKDAMKFSGRHATQRILDSFESGSPTLDVYVINNVSSDSGVKSDTVRLGHDSTNHIDTCDYRDNILSIGNISGGDSSFISLPGGTKPDLPSYPSPANEKIRYYVETDSGTRGLFLFGWSGTSGAVSGGGKGYFIELDPPNNRIRLVRSDSDSSFFVLSSVDVSLSAFEWYEVQLLWEDDEVMRIELFDSSGKRLAEIFDLDTSDYTGGIGWQVKANADGYDARFDHFRFVGVNQ